MEASGYFWICWRSTLSSVKNFIHKTLQHLNVISIKWEFLFCTWFHTWTGVPCPHIVVVVSPRCVIHHFWLAVGIFTQLPSINFFFHIGNVFFCGLRWYLIAPSSVCLSKCKLVGCLLFLKKLLKLDIFDNCSIVDGYWDLVGFG